MSNYQAIENVIRIISRPRPGQVSENRTRCPAYRSGARRKATVATAGSRYGANERVSAICSRDPEDHDDGGHVSSGGKAGARKEFYLLFSLFVRHKNGSAVSRSRPLSLSPPPPHPFSPRGPVIHLPRSPFH